MEPFFFDGDRGRLFGVYHAPAGPVSDRPGVVICYPAGSEYENAHRTCVHLAQALSGAGLHTLRFDYFGCGDSEGDFKDADLDGWVGDVLAAVAQLKNGTGVEHVALAGLRFGAALGLVCAGREESVSELALCDPVLDGAGYLDELGRRHRQRLLEVSLTEDPPAADGEGRELLGYTWPAALLRGIGALDFTAPSSLPAVRALVVESTARPSLNDFTGALRSCGCDVEQRCIESLQTWRRPGETRVPLGLIDTVVRWLQGDRQ